MLLVAYCLTLFIQYRNLSSECVIEPYGEYHSMFVIGLGYIGITSIVNNVITSGVVAQQINSNCILRFTIKRELSG